MSVDGSEPSGASIDLSTFAFPLTTGPLNVPLSVNDVARHFQQVPWVPRTFPAIITSHAVDGLALAEMTEADWEEFFHVHEVSMQQQLCAFVENCKRLTQ